MGMINITMIVRIYCLLYLIDYHSYAFPLNCRRTSTFVAATASSSSSLSTSRTVVIMPNQCSFIQNSATSRKRILPTYQKRKCCKELTLRYAATYCSAKKMNNEDEEKGGGGVGERDEYDDDCWDALNFKAEINRRNHEKSNLEKNSSGGRDSSSESVDTQDNDNDEDKFDGYDLRDVLLVKYGHCFDLDFRRVEAMGKRTVYLNVIPVRLGNRKFRHDSEFDYLCHLQAIVEVLIKYNTLDSVLAQLFESTKMPRPNTNPIVAVPLRLDLTKEQLNQIW